MECHNFPDLLLLPGTTQVLTIVVNQALYSTVLKHLRIIVVIALVL